MEKTNKTPEPTSLAAYLRMLRGATSLRKLADDLGVNASFLSRLESGEVISASEDLLGRLAARFELSPNDQRLLFLMAGKLPQDVRFFFEKDQERALALLRRGFKKELDNLAHTLIADLQELGITPTVAQLYLQILQSGPLDRGALGPDADGALHELLRRRLVFYDRQHAGQVYFALDPKTAFKALWDETLWASAVGEAEIARLPVQQATALLRVRELTSELAQLAGQFYAVRRPISAGQIRIAGDEEEMTTALVDVISRADAEIASLSRSPLLPQVAPVWEAIKERVGHGVTYRRVVDLAEVIAHGLYIKRRDMNEVGVDLRVLEEEAIDRKFTLVDRRRVILFFPSEVAEGFQHAGQVIENGWIASRMAREFKSAWDQALPGAFVVDCLEGCAQQLVEKAGAVLGSKGELWMRAVIDWGIFARPLEFNEDEQAAIREKAARAGLVQYGPNSSTQPVPLYPIGLADIRRRYVELQVKTGSGAQANA